MASRFRAVWRWVTPYWLQNGDGGKVGEALMTLVDANVQRLRDGMIQRYPSYAGEEALALLGRDRGILRGRDETAEHYAARLIAWRWPRGHRVRGNAFALLEQWAEYWGSLGAVAVFTAKGKRCHRDTDGTQTKTAVSWTWDTEPASQWSRFWGWLDGSALFTVLSFPYADTDTIGLGGSTVGDWRAVVGLLYGKRPWRMAGSLPMWLVVSLDGSEPTPDATWERWGKVDGTNLVPSRPTTMRFVAMRDALREYPGDPERWTNGSSTTEFGVITGDPDSFPATISLPDGTSYAGNPDNFPATITLPDDAGTMT